VCYKCVFCVYHHHRRRRRRRRRQALGQVACYDLIFFSHLFIVYAVDLYPLG
jgi:hypothetical protein